MRPVFYHFTDDATRLALGPDGTIMPGGPLNVVWMSNQLIPTQGGASLGLTPETGACRYIVADDSSVKPWTEVRDQYPPELWWPLELAAGAQPELWFVSTEPVRVKYSGRGVRA